MQIPTKKTLMITCLFVHAGFSKKLQKAASERGCFAIHGWTRSIMNHMYWSAVSTPDDEGELRIAKWRSVVNHIQNVHEGHGDLFPECAHGELQGKDGKKRWIQPSQLLLQICHCKYLLSAVK